MVKNLFKKVNEEEKVIQLGAKQWKVDDRFLRGMDYTRKCESREGKLVALVNTHLHSLLCSSP